MQWSDVMPKMHRDYVDSDMSVMIDDPCRPEIRSEDMLDAQLFGRTDPAGDGSRATGESGRGPSGVRRPRAAAD